MEYNSLKRVILSLDHKEPDRVPFDLGGALVCGINVVALKNLKKYLGLKSETKVYDKITQLGEMTDDVIKKLEIDIVSVAPELPSNSGLEKDLGREGNYLKYMDEFGIEYRMPVKGGHYYDIYKSPLRNANSIEDIRNYPWPDPLDEQRFINLKEKAKKVVFEDKRAYFLERMSAGMWENAIWMVGYEKFFMDMITNKKFIHAIMDKFLEIKCKYWEKALETVGKNVLVVSTADDIGATETLLVSKDLYKELIWPYHKKLFRFIKEKAKSKVYIFFHSDGAIKETIPLLIEAGIDILNPVQVNCKGMDTKNLKKEFGKDLTFWGGSCDNRILSFGTPKEVKEETKRRILDLAPGGGFIFAPIHIVQSEVPPENIIAWWETLKSFGVY
jgi:uroporphyrinogen decarboxylase